jgi:hypothetical protein
MGSLNEIDQSLGVAKIDEEQARLPLVRVAHRRGRWP